MGKSYWTLSCKVYLICHHLFFLRCFLLSRNRSRHQKPQKKDKHDRWPVTAFFIAFGLAIVLSLFSETTLVGLPLAIAVIVLLLIVFIGIVADTLGTALAIEDVTAYTAMASKKIRGAKEAIRLIRNADRLCNICNDIIGDICSIVAGAMGVAIIARLFSTAGEDRVFFYNVLLSSLISGLTVFGKAIGKKLALGRSHEIVFQTAIIVSWFHR